MTVATEQKARHKRMLRMGTFFWKLPPKMRDTTIDGLALVRQLVARLREDPRVVLVRDPDRDFDTDYTRETFYPSDASDLDSILFGTDVMTALCKSFPIAFRVRVPIKNQPLRDGVADIPSDTYTAVWNGVTLVVLWSQADDAIPFSGGHIVIDVLRDAVEGEPGSSLINQACSPGCQFQFMHPTIRLDPLTADQIDDGVDFNLSKIPGRDHFIIAASDADDDDEIEAALGLTYTLIHTANQFANVKTLGQRIIAIEDTARNELSNAIALQYKKAKISLLPLQQRVYARWKSRSTTRQLRETLFALYLCLTNLEKVMRIWEEESRTFKERASEEGLLPFFEGDSKSDEVRIQSLRLNHLESAVEQVSESLNNSAMVAATLGGALAGGLAGGALGAVATAIGG